MKTRVSRIQPLSAQHSDFILWLSLVTSKELRQVKISSKQSYFAQQKNEASIGLTCLVYMGKKETHHFIRHKLDNLKDMTTLCVFNLIRIFHLLRYTST